MSNRPADTYAAERIVGPLPASMTAEVYETPSAATKAGCSRHARSTAGATVSRPPPSLNIANHPSRSAS